MGSFPKGSRLRAQRSSCRKKHSLAKNSPSSTIKKSREPTKEVEIKPCFRLLACMREASMRHNSARTWTRTHSRKALLLADFHNLFTLPEEVVVGLKVKVDFPLA